MCASGVPVHRARSEKILQPALRRCEGRGRDLLRLRTSGLRAGSVAFRSSFAYRQTACLRARLIRAATVRERFSGITQFRIDRDLIEKSGAWRRDLNPRPSDYKSNQSFPTVRLMRSEERRVGKECR